MGGYGMCFTALGFLEPLLLSATLFPKLWFLNESISSRAAAQAKPPPNCAGCGLCAAPEKRLCPQLVRCVEPPTAGGRAEPRCTRGKREPELASIAPRKQLETEGAVLLHV